MIEQIEPKMKIVLNKTRVKNFFESFKMILFIRISVIAIVMFCIKHYFLSQQSEALRESDGPMSFVIDENQTKHIYDSRTHPLIFIGGHPRSGTTLMRALLDAHTDVRCGEETRFLQNFIQMRENLNSPNEKPRLIQGGITDVIIDRAMAALVMETIAQHGYPAKVLCNKDPFLLKTGSYISQLFPKSKWIFMIRDGRAVAHSIISRKITFSGGSNDDPKKVFKAWNAGVKELNNECEKVGPTRCLKVQYEKLVLQTRRTMESILTFMGLPWDEAVMHHEEFINQDGPHGIHVSNRERSSDQVIKPVNLEALTQWVGSFPSEIIDRMESIAPMLKVLGYDPLENPPNYGTPDQEVLEKTRILKEEKDIWEEKSAKLIAEMAKPA